MSITSSGQAAINLALVLSRYIRQFIRIEPQVALQYVYCVCLSSDQGSVGKEQVEVAWELCRRVILMAEVGGGWAELVGGFRPDGTRFVSHLTLHLINHLNLSLDGCHRTGSQASQIGSESS